MLLKDVLLIFLKYPKPGLVKTRLAKDIGKQKASQLYRLCAEAILSRTKDKDYSRVIFYSPPEKKKQIRDWLGWDSHIYPQRGNDLGERLSAAFQFIFKKGAKRAVAIGTDSPALDSRLINEALGKLKDSKCVLGPALDGGYYLIGLTAFHQEIFSGINWGENDVLEKTKYKLRKSGLEFSLLEPHLDIDTLGDLYLLKETPDKNPGDLSDMFKILTG